MQSANGGDGVWLTSPEAQFYAVLRASRACPEEEGTALRRRAGDESDGSWSNDIDQALFRGSLALDEVVFVHRASLTAIFDDLIQRLPEGTTTGWKGLVMRLDGVVGQHGSTPREWRLSFLSRRAARAARRRVLEWTPQRLLLAHGGCATTGATGIIAAALSWI